MAGTDLSAWFAQVFDSASELDYREALDWFGLRFASEESSHHAWLGADTKDDNGHLVITRIPRGTPAYDAGLDTNDELISFNGFRVRPTDWDRQLSNFHPDDRLRLVVSRRGRSVPIEVTLGREPVDRWTLEVSDQASPHRTAW